MELLQSGRCSLHGRECVEGNRPSLALPDWFSASETRGIDACRPDGLPSTVADSLGTVSDTLDRLLVFWNGNLADVAAGIRQRYRSAGQADTSMGQTLGNSMDKLA